MKSALIGFLTSEYSRHHGVVWDAGSMRIRFETPSSLRFEIADKQTTIVQAPRHGVAIHRRREMLTEVVDIEDYMRQVHREDKTPKTCDFVLAPEAGYDFIVFNELSFLDSKSILRLPQIKKGEEDTGKFQKAKKQLISTIESFYEVNNFLDKYTDKYAVFSFRLKDKSHKSIMAESIRKFGMPMQTQKQLKMREEMPHGFVFRIRMYPECNNI